MSYTIGQAAKATGIHKTTISKAIKKGKISATLLEDGSYKIDPAELHRVYPPVSAKENIQQSNGIHEATEYLHQIKQLEIELKAANKMIDVLNSDKEFLKSELSKTTLLLEDHRTRKSKSFWPW